MAEWTFLTSHAKALLCIANDPGVRLRDIATTLGITERSAFAVVDDLAAAGCVVKERDGRRNRYEIQHHLPLREGTAPERIIGDVLDVMVGTTGADHDRARPRRKSGTAKSRAASR